MRIAMVVALCAGLFGCSLNRAFVHAVKTYADIILPEYKSYVAGDTTLREDSKRIRLRTADKFSDLISEALRESEK